MLARAGRTIGRRKAPALAAAAIAVLCCLVGVAASQAAAVSADLLKVRLGGDAVQTRIVIDLNRAATAKVVSDGAGDHRLVLMMPGVTLADPQQGAGHGLVKTWLVDQNGHNVRLQMDLAANAVIKRRFLLPPADGIDNYRYVIDLTSAEPVTLTSAKAHLGARLRLQPAAPLSLKKVIVIDAGHGGKDVGAQGVQGFEKDVNLAAALALKARLERSGRYKVVMTRDTDVYVPLESRVRIAQRAGADLFISLHSDSGTDPAVRGASVYTLSDKASNRATRFVSKDDWFMKASLVGDRGVSDILFDLTQRATKNRSAAFAQTLVSHIDGEAPLLRRSQRDAGYMVLLAPDVPAVLMEMGFVTSPEDEERLRDPQQRARLMDAVADSIDDYFAQATRLAAR
jgi:N-acetylmuramoyl-L-alanine amidase